MSAETGVPIQIGFRETRHIVHTDISKYRGWVRLFGTLVIEGDEHDSPEEAVENVERLLTQALQHLFAPWTTNPWEG